MEVENDQLFGLPRLPANHQLSVKMPLGKPPPTPPQLIPKTPVGLLGERILCSSEAAPVCMERIFSDVF